MKKLYNLKEFSNIYSTENKELISSFIEADNQPIKEREIEDLKSLINVLELKYKVFEGFFIGYKVPHIGHEMDLLKVTDSAILNIELKSQSELSKINKQQKYNYFYLQTLNMNVDIITFNKDLGIFYTYCPIIEKSIEISVKDVREIFCKYAEEKFLYDIDYLFKPSKFLISPFNDTNKFLEEKYYLTSEQEIRKKEILNHEGTIAIIDGSPGTGKSLLLYDIAKTLIKQDSKILMIHCGLLNGGHDLMKDKMWNIKSANSKWIFNEAYYENIDRIFIDESHRFYPRQLEFVVKIAIQKNIKIIAAIDPNQYLRDNESNFNNLERLKEYTGTYYKKLGKKIRSNPEIGNFVKNIMNLNSKIESRFKNISIEFLSNDDAWKPYIEELESEGWKYLSFTKSRDTISYHKYCSTYSDYNSHRVIGQEFNKVVVILNEGFKYDNAGYLGYYGGYYYNPRQMLFQNLTRAREKIKIIIINNIELYKNINTILNKSRNRNEVTFKIFSSKINNDELKLFYRDLLGFELKNNQTSKPEKKISFQIGKTNVSFYESGFNYNQYEIEIKVDNLNHFRERILARDIDLIDDVNEKKFKYLTLKDPLKNKLKLIEKV